MFMSEYTKKVNLVDKYLNKKKFKKLLTMKLENFNEEYLYIGIVYHLKSKTFKVFFIDIYKMENNNIEDWFNINLIYPNDVDYLKNIIVINGISNNYTDKDDIDSKITINSYITNYKYNKREFIFKRYIPKCWDFLDEVVYILMNSLPKRLFYIYQIMIEKLLKPELNYLFAFDLKKDNLEYLFNDDNILKGINLYNNNKVLYLESINKVYYGIVEEKINYLTKVIYDNNIKEIQLSCSCGSNHFCHHLYATLQSIKNNNIKRYYKVIKKDKNKKNILEKINNLEYFLCIGIYNNNLIIIENDSLIGIPINKYFDYEIIEDDDKKTLENKIKKLL